MRYSEGTEFQSAVLQRQVNLNVCTPQQIEREISRNANNVELIRRCTHTHHIHTHTPTLSLSLSLSHTHTRTHTHKHKGQHYANCLC
jgi:hypothetical protein